MGIVHQTRPSDGVLRLELDNPPVNPLGPDMCVQLIEALAAADNDRSVRAIILTASGNSFCTGGDLRSTEMIGTGFPEALDAVAKARRPVIAAVNGHCLGGGLELALSCDLRIASHNATFAAGGVNMGLIVSTVRLPRLIGAARAKALLLTGAPHDAATAERWGIVTALYAREELDAAALQLAERVASRAPLAVEAAKQAVNGTFDLTFDEALEAENAMIVRLRETEDHREAVQAFREKRQPQFKGT